MDTLVGGPVLKGISGG